MHWSAEDTICWCCIAVGLLFLSFLSQPNLAECSTGWELGCCLVLGLCFIFFLLLKRCCSSLAAWACWETFLPSLDRGRWFQWVYSKSSNLWGAKAGVWVLSPLLFSQSKGPLKGHLWWWLYPKQHRNPVCVPFNSVEILRYFIFNLLCGLNHAKSRFTIWKLGIAPFLKEWPLTGVLAVAQWVKDLGLFQLWHR